MTFSITLLGTHHVRKDFDSGVKELDVYIRVNASQDMRRRLCKPYVLAGQDCNVKGYYTLSSADVNMDLLPAAVVRKLPRYPTAPAALIGRLAVDKSLQGQGYGEDLLADAILRSMNNHLACMLVAVDAKNQAATLFYKKYGFKELVSQPGRLILDLNAL